MLGAIKIKGEASVSLFRSLSRRWAPVVPIKSSLPSSSRMSGLEKDEAASPKRAWIGVKRQSAPVAPTVNAKRSSDSTWNPWLWTK